MKLSAFGVVAASAVLFALVDVGAAHPVRLERRDNPVTKVIEYVIYGNKDQKPHEVEEGHGYATPAAHHDRPAAYHGSASESERQVLCLVNKERRRHGLRPLALHPAMTRAAYEHSEYQSRVRSMTHSDPQNGQLGSRLQRNGFSFASASENIAEAPGVSPKEVFDMWINDPPHYENIVDPNARYMGLACVDGFWTQDFGSAADSHGEEPQYETHEYC
ncbi:hypothetical protein GGI04_001605 [Coemansia thaxteri]|uniref:SCP domain-containing protein n=1 Tax=Coemansia thaxteri TaxID=2663907 RepID=A0A9W8EM51_9FUNG|nr:hypothetical protein GGI04_001605 [Coemansia thaxteri]KAJ2008067.1 hypothetical protein H4R26_000411 [Coemansia thaxteri]KAJ2471524.1 hypothetical protein GGI02_002214 [Coemansia sp. RSA 2322]